MGELADVPEENFTTEWVAVYQLTYNKTNKRIYRERREHRVFQELLKSVPGLEERLLQGSEEEVDIIADLVNFSVVRCTEN